MRDYKLATEAVNPLHRSWDCYRINCYKINSCLNACNDDGINLRWSEKKKKRVMGRPALGFMMKPIIKICSTDSWPRITAAVWSR